MSDNNQAVEWYLARDGQQHGPVSDIELQKIIEFGYLKPTDLVWRQGMAEWAAAETVLNLPSPPPAPPPPPPSPPPSAPAAPSPAPHASRARLEPEPGPSYAGPGDNAPGPRAPEPHHPRAYAPAGDTGFRPGVDPAQAPQPRDPRMAQQAPRWEPRPQRPDAYPHQGQHPGQPHHGQHPSLGAPATGQPSPSPHQPAPQRPVPQLQPGPMPAADSDFVDEPERSGGFPWRAAAVLVLLAGLGGGGYALYRTGKLSSLPFLGAPATERAVPVVAAPSGPDRVAATPGPDPKLQGPVRTIDESLQKSPLWQRLKRDFPDWYGQRLTEAAGLAAESRSEKEVAQALTRSVVELRRKHHAEALAAGPARLRQIASTFVDNLGQLQRHSTAACYGYISQGEASPAIAELNAPAQRKAIDSQLASIFEAVTEGRKSPAKREPPKREDYDVLTAELGKRGWTPADLQLFADARSLARAAPEKVCQMVQDWFAAQLAVKDEAVQLRLLGEALKPVVAG